MEKHIYFVRHGQSESNVDHVHRGKDAELTEQGRAQAAIVADRVAKLGVEALISSDFIRAQDTAAAISEKIALLVQEEPIFGEWLETSENIGRHREHPENKASFQHLFDNAHDPHAKYGDEESFHELATRAESCLSLLAEHPAERICVVTHFAFLSVIIGAVLFRDKFTKAEFLDLFMHLFSDNTGITYIRYDDARGWRLATWNDSAHLG